MPKHLRDNPARFHKDKLLVSLLKVRDGNNVKSELIKIRAIEHVKIQENVEENESN